MLGGRRLLRFDVAGGVQLLTAAVPLLFRQWPLLPPLVGRPPPRSTSLVLDGGRRDVTADRYSGDGSGHLTNGVGDRELGSPPSCACRNKSHSMSQHSEPMTKTGTKVLTPGRIDHLAADVTYLQFPIHVCFCSTLPNLFFPISLFRFQLKWTVFLL